LLSFQDSITAVEGYGDDAPRAAVVEDIFNTVRGRVRQTEDVLNALRNAEEVRRVAAEREIARAQVVFDNAVAYAESLTRIALGQVVPAAEIVPAAFVNMFDIDNGTPGADDAEEPAIQVSLFMFKCYHSISCFLSTLPPSCLLRW
jgi:hypothetical protein